MCSKDTMSFWKAWRKPFGMSKLKPAQTVNGKFGDNNIIDELSTFYKNIYVPNSPCSDDQFACRVESWLQQSTYLANDANASFITVNLLYDCNESLKLQKAGHNGVTSEHIVFGGNDLAVHLCLLFNSMLRHSFVPSDFRFGLIKPVLNRQRYSHNDSISLGTNSFCVVPRPIFSVELIFAWAIFVSCIFNEIICIFAKNSNFSYFLA